MENVENTQNKRRIHLQEVHLLLLYLIVLLIIINNRYRHVLSLNIMIPVTSRSPPAAQLRTAAAILLSEHRQAATVIRRRPEKRILFKIKGNLNIKGKFTHICCLQRQPSYLNLKIITACCACRILCIYVKK